MMDEIAAKGVAYLERELERARRKVAVWQDRVRVLEHHLEDWHKRNPRGAGQDESPPAEGR